MGKGSGLPRSQVRTHADKVKGSWAWQASSRPSAEVECHSWALNPSDPHTVQDGEALPESKGQCCLVHVGQMWIRQEKGRK